MNDDLLLNSINIWQWLGIWTANYKKIEDWSILVDYNQELFEIFPVSSLQQDKIIKIDDEFHTKNYYSVADGKSRYLSTGKWIVPVRINQKMVFCFCIYGNLPDFEAGTWQSALESMLVAESRELRKYPSFLPFLFPYHDPDIAIINQSLLEKKKIYFLNGLNGTGKHTFIRNHINYCYGDFVDIYKIKDNELKNVIKIQSPHNKKNWIIINELALLSEIDQRDLFESFNENSDKSFFICSAYDPVVLVKKGVLIPEFESICIENRIRFPSLQRRQSYLFKVLTHYFFCKGRSLPFFITENWVKNHFSNDGFDELFKSFNDFFQPQSSIGDIFEHGGGIRDTVSSLEASGIIFAQKIIGNSQNKIARFLGISRGSLQHKLKKYQIPYHDWEE